jgi:hypothetical protein
MTEGLIERAARAIANKRNEFLGLPPAWWGDSEWNGTDLVLTPNERDLYRAEARAALEAAGIEKMREALEPFAKAADVKLCGEWRDDEHFGQTDVGFYLTFGDLRRARAALSTNSNEQSGGSDVDRNAEA